MHIIIMKNYLPRKIEVTGVTNVLQPDRNKQSNQNNYNSNYFDLYMHKKLAN